MDKFHCPLCGAEGYTRKNKATSLTYKRHTLNYIQPGNWCDTCDDGVLEPEDLKHTRKQIMTFCSNVDGLLPPDEIKRIRLKLKLNQKQA